MKAKPKKAVSYDGINLDSSVTKKSYKVIEIKGKRVVLGDGLNTAFHIDNLSYLISFYNKNVIKILWYVRSMITHLYEIYMLK